MHKNMGLCLCMTLTLNSVHAMVSSHERTVMRAMMIY